MQLAPQDIQLMSKHRVLSFKPYLRLERRGQDGQNETEQPEHSASLGDSITASTQIRVSVHTGGQDHAAQREDCNAASGDTAPERSEHSDDADRGQADIANRSRCALDGHKW